MIENVNNMKNILITGSRQIGKTTCIRKVLELLEVNVAGYQTLPYEMNGTFYGYEMINLVTGKKQAISQRKEDGKFVGIESAFETFGVNCLKEAIDSSLNLIVLDEIGRFESNSKNFIRQLHKVFDSHKTVIAVIKKEPIAFIEEIKSRDDVLLLDFDIISANDAFHRILSIIKL